MTSNKTTVQTIPAQHLLLKGQYGNPTGGSETFFGPQGGRQAISSLKPHTIQTDKADDPQSFATKCVVPNLFYINHSKRQKYGDHYRVPFLFFFLHMLF